MYKCERSIWLYFEKSLERLLLILAALFLWMTFFLAALSASDIAFRILALVLCLDAALIAASRLLLIILLTDLFLPAERNALLAVLVIGMSIV